MKDIVEIRWHGRGGQGAKTASLLLADAAFNTGKYVQGFPEYGPERMGAPITAYNRISSERSTVHSNIYEPDYVVVVDETLLSAVDVTAGLKKEGAIIVNTAKSPEEILPQLNGYEGRVVTVDARKISEETLGKYPFAFTLYITHRFSEENPRELLVSWEVINENDDTMYYSIGGHPAFRVPENPKESRDQYWLEFPGKEHLEYLLLNPQNGLAATGTTYDLKLRDGCYPIEEHLFDRDALVFEGGQIGEVRIDRPDKTPYVTLRCAGFPFVGIWSKPDGAFVCLEPWMGRTDDDGFTGDLAEKTGVESLKARENRMYTYGIEFH